MTWSCKDRNEFLAGLDTVESVVVRFYRLLLGIIVLVVLAVVALVIVKRPWGAGTQGEWFYFSIAVIAVLGWALDQFLMLHRRRQNQRSSVKRSPTTTEKTWTWEFRMGTSPQTFLRQSQCNETVATGSEQVAGTEEHLALWPVSSTGGSDRATRQ